MMKKISISILFLIFTLNLFAQRNNFSASSFRLGLTAYPNFGFIKAENGKGNGTSLGFAYGLIGDFNFAENYSFSTGILITTLNGKSIEINPNPYASNGIGTLQTAYNLKYKMQYLEIPLTIKLKTSEIGNKRWFGQFGLSNDFRLSSTQDAERNGTILADDINANNVTNFYRAGIIIGVGAEFNLSGKTTLLTGLTLNNGFTNLSSVNKNIRNHNVALNFAIFF